MDDRPRLPCEEERNPPFGVLWCRALSAPAWPLSSVHRKSEDVFFLLFGQISGLKHSLSDREQLLVKRTPNLCLNVCNLLCLHACSSPPPPYLTSSINKTAFWVAHSVVWGWQIDDSWFAPRGDAGRDQKIKQNTEIKGWILWEEKRTVVEKKGHNSSVIPLRTPAANAATRGGRLRRFRSDQWTHPEGTKDTYREETLCNLFVCAPVFICVCVCSPLAECATAKKPQSHFYRVTGVRGDPTASAPLPWE